MKSGALRDRITIQAPSIAQDDTGQRLTAWSDFALVWANVQYTSGLSAIRSGMDVSSVKVSIRIRYLAGVHAGMRLLHDGAEYSIEAVLPNKAERTVDLVCVVRNAES